MSADSKIEWTDHTFNTWWGCARVSSGCRNCYADTLASRWGHELWRRHGPRKSMADAYWRGPVKWNKAGPARVFCGSMCDVFEAHPEPDVQAMQNAARARLWDLIEATPNLTWQLLTKRPENILGMVPWGDRWPQNVWTGTSVEDQKAANLRIPLLLRVPGVRFVSAEPLLGPVRMAGRAWLPVSADDADPDAECSTCGTEEFSDLPEHPVIHRCDDHEPCDEEGEETGEFCAGPIRPYPHIDWVIVGGESGAGARPMHPDWARSLRDQCVAARVPFFFKQWGEWCPSGATGWGSVDPSRSIIVGPPVDEHGSGRELVRVGKKAAGRELDGRTWDEFPAVRS